MFTKFPTSTDDFSNGHYTNEELPQIPATSRAQVRNSESQIQNSRIFLDLSTPNVNVQKNGSQWKTSLTQQINNVFELGLERIHVVNPVGISYGDVLVIKFFQENTLSMKLKTYSNNLFITSETLVIPVKDISTDTILAVPVIKFDFQPSLTIQSFRQPVTLKDFNFLILKKDGTPVAHDALQMYLSVKTIQWQ